MDKDKIEQGIKLILEGIEEDIEREGLRETPNRIARMYEELLAGMKMNPVDVMKKTFKTSYTDIIIEKDISFYSMCEHHMLPFFGNVYIAYVPKERVLGLSKLARVVEIYARRLQLQERMTEEIADAIYNNISAEGVLVLIEAEHLCMSMRGIKKKGSKTITISSKGMFTVDDKMKQRAIELMRVS